jgi:hypothetical protein
MRAQGVNMSTLIRYAETVGIDLDDRLIAKPLTAKKD